MSQETREEALRRLNRWTPGAARTAALKLARGDYQRGIITGEYAWSGADLRGTAKSYAGRYRKSREALLERILEAGIPARIETVNRHGKLALVFGAKST